MSDRTSSRRPGPIRTFAAAVLCLAAHNAHAGVFCVHDSGELGAALIAAEGDGQGDQIHLVAGTYALSGIVNLFSEESLELDGGWNAGCTQRTLNPFNTVIDGGNTQFMLFHVGHTLTLDGIRFHRVPIFDIAAGNTQMRHDVFTGGQGNDALRVEGSSGSVLLDSNVFDGKNVEILNRDTSEATSKVWHVINNTFVNAAVGSSNEYILDGYGLNLEEPGSGLSLHIVLANNALWNNATGGIRINHAPEVLATHNNWQSLVNANNVALASGSTGNSNADPQLDSNYIPIVPGSPAINSGTISVPGGLGATDAGGNARVIGTAPDRGAYESPVDDSATLTVTTNADSGTGSLREALTSAAQAANAQRIVFNLSSCPQIVNVSSALPEVVDTLTIDGYTQPGSSANTRTIGSDARLCVILRGNYANSTGLTATDLNSHLTVRGLAFANFGIAGIDISDGDSHIIEGNQFGGILAVGASGSLTLEANARGLRLRQDSANSYVGGIDPQQRNVFDGSSVYGVSLIGNYGGHELRNNYIGLAPNGSDAAGNGIGVIVSSAYNLLDGNYIAASGNEGVQLQGNATFMGYPQVNVLTANIIGLPAVQGVDSASNYGAGVRAISTANGNLIGLDAHGLIAGNVIVGNGLNGVGGPGNGSGGVSIESGSGNRISGNLIYSNYGQAIDLGADGPTANDATDSDSGANGFQNFPVLTAIRHTAGARLLSGSIYISSGTRIEVFGAAQCGNAGRAQAAMVLSIDARPLIAPFGGGTANFTLTIGRGPGSGPDQYCRIGATATDVDGNTSEMSGCFVDDTIFAHDFDSSLGFACAP
ncbi:MAG: choice-of-anchor Q domain-containing protein [Rudaea sp.]